MASVMDLLTKEDKYLIDNYRFRAPMSDYVEMGGRCSVEYFLRKWESAKNVQLKNIFSDSLILEEPFEYTISKQELTDAMEALINRSRYEDSRVSYKFNCQQNFYHSFCKKVFDSRAYGISDKYFEIREWFSPEVLIENKQLSSTFSIITEDCKTIKFQEGSKVMRNIRKMADLLGVDGFEDFCNAHSQILNQKSVKGTLCLSIHPLDYMTMSDNCEGWSSCMSWENGGCYSTGTLEMLNSPSVVVAYLASDSRNYNFRDAIARDGSVLSWNSKKWRTLVVVENDLIAAVKSYPYQNDGLSAEVVTKLAKLMQDKCGVEYHSLTPQPIEYAEGDGATINCPDEDNQVRIIFETGHMYNDFGCVEHHMMVFSKNFIENGASHHRAFYDYSGCPVCVCCGEEDVESDDCLACEDCNGYATYCDECGRRTCEDDSYYFDGVSMCEDCYSSNTFEDPVSLDRYWNSDGVEVYLTVPGQTKPITESRFCMMAEENLNDADFKELFGELSTTTVEYTYGETTYYHVSLENLSRKGKTFFDIWHPAVEERYIEIMKGN